MIKPTLAGDPERGRSAANCRKGAERCRACAAESADWWEEDEWLECASVWTELAEAFENEDRLSLN